MNNLTSLHSNIPLFIILSVLFAAGFVAFRFYRESDPPVASRVKYLLIALRTLVLFFVVMVALNPRISWSERHEVPRRIGVYIDHSASMGLKSDRENRADSLLAALSDLHKSLSGFSLHKYYFNTHLTVSDTVPRLMGGTDFNPVLGDVQKQHWDAVILISDGIRSAGSPPQAETSPPIFSIGLGALKNAPDIFIKQVDYPPRVVQGREQHIRVRLANRSVTSVTATVRLYAGKKIVGRQSVKIKNADSGQNITFIYRPPQPGPQKFRVTVGSNLKERDIRNNRFDFIWDVKKSALRIGLFSMAPNMEHKFFNLALSDNKDFERYSLIALPGVHFRQKVLDSLDVMVWLEFPTRRTTSAMWHKVLGTLKKKRPGLIVFLGPRTDSAKLERAAGLPGLKKLERRTSPFQDVISISEPLNPLMDPFQSAQLSRAFWSALPPVVSYFDLIPQGTNLATLQRLPGHSLLTMSDGPGQKSLIYNGASFWKARFTLYDQPRIAAGYTRFVQGIVRWAADHKKLRPVVLESDKQKYFPGEGAAMAVYIYDVQGELLRNGRATLTAERGGRSFQIPVQRDSSGVFRARYEFNGTGDFKLKANGFVDGVAYGTAQKKIHVTPYNPEFARMRQDSVFLKQLARSSNGAYLTLAGIPGLRALLGSPMKKNRLDKEIDIRYNLFYLFLLVFLLSAEWIIRKRVKLI